MLVGPLQGEFNLVNEIFCLCLSGILSLDVFNMLLISSSADLPQGHQQEERGQLSSDEASGQGQGQDQGQGQGQGQGQEGEGEGTEQLPAFSLPE